jgi:hypothetical protein
MGSSLSSFAILPASTLPLRCRCSAMTASCTSGRFASSNPICSNNFFNNWPTCVKASRLGELADCLRRATGVAIQLHFAVFQVRVFLEYRHPRLQGQFVPDADDFAKAIFPVAHLCRAGQSAKAQIGQIHGSRYYAMKHKRVVAHSVENQPTLKTVYPPGTHILVL